MNKITKSAFVTGAARGIGRAVAERFLAEGYAVALVDIDGPTLRTTGKELAGQGHVLALECDVSDPAQVQARVPGQEPP